MDVVVEYCTCIIYLVILGGTNFCRQGWLSYIFLLKEEQFWNPFESSKSQGSLSSFWLQWSLQLKTANLTTDWKDWTSIFHLFQVFVGPWVWSTATHPWSSDKLEAIRLLLSSGFAPRFDARFQRYKPRGMIEKSLSRFEPNIYGYIYILRERERESERARERASYYDYMGYINPRLLNKM